MKKIFLVLPVFIFFSCATTNMATKSTKDLSKSIGKIEATVDNMENLNNKNKELISSASKSADDIKDEIERLEFLFNTYQNMNHNLIFEKEKEIEELKNILKEMKSNEE